MWESILLKYGGIVVGLVIIDKLVKSSSPSTDLDKNKTKKPETVRLKRLKEKYERANRANFFYFSTYFCLIVLAIATWLNFRST
jgi:hypothetical protein